jgi:ankyrin repeat protein
MRAAVGPCVTVLVAAGAAGAHAAKMHYLTSLHTAVSSGQIGSVVQLLQKPTFVEDVLNMKALDACDCCGHKTVLMICKQPAVTKLLIAAGADVSVTTMQQCTCLHVAAAHSCPASVICLLIKAGVDLHAVNSSGKTAAEVAHDAGNTLIEQLLNRAAQQA